MKLPFASFLTLLLLLTITTNAKTLANKLHFSDICKQTKQPKVCLVILNDDPRTRRASTLHDLGSGCFDIGISLAKSSAEVFNNNLITAKNAALKQKHADCRDKYKLVVQRLNDAKNLIRVNDVATTRKALDLASSLITSCRKGLGEMPAKVKRDNETLNVILDIGFVILAACSKKSINA